MTTVEKCFNDGMSEFVTSIEKFDVDDLKETFEKVKMMFEDSEFLSDEDVKSLLCLSLEKQMGDSLRKCKSSKERIQLLENVLTLSMGCTNKSMCPSETVFKLVDLAFDMFSVQECSEAWTIMEKHQNVLSQSLFMGEEGKNSLSKLKLLQLCNRILHRCSQQLDTRFSGRILMFLASACPLAERSGVNIAGAFNEENITEFEKPDDESSDEVGVIKKKKKKTTKMDVDEEQEPQLLNYRLYRNFWKVQQYFADPNESLKSVDEWKAMLRSLSDVLETFENVNLSNRKVQRVQNQCSKFLTKRSLLRLQVNDPVMRRNVLLQVLFMLQYLSEENSAKIDRLLRSGEGVSKLDRAKELNPHLKRTFRLLEQAGMDGKTFRSTSKDILSREQFWIQWKEEKCRPYTRRPVEKINEEERQQLEKGGGNKKRIIEMQLKKGREQFAKVAEEYQPTDNLTCLSDGSNFHIPPLDEFLQPFRDAEDPEEGIEEEYHPKNQPVYCWRGFRLLTGSHLNVLDSRDSKQKLIDLSTALKKLQGDDSKMDQEEEKDVDKMDEEEEDNKDEGEEREKKRRRKK